MRFRDPQIAEMARVASLLDARMEVQPANPYGVAAANPSATPTAGSQISTTGQNIVAPGAATSPYEFQYVEGAKVVLGPELGALLNLPGNSPVSGGQILQQYYDLPASQLAALQQVLYSAGMYSNTAGEPSSQRPVFGALDLQSFTAISQAILQAGNTGLKTSMSQLLANATNSGAGYASQQNALQPVLGGGNTYQVNLTNPQDIYSTTNQVFQQELGRNPTDKEYSAVLKIVQQGQTQAQQAQIGQQEGMSQQKYQQQVTARTAENTPASVTGQVPNGPFASAAQEAVSILQYAFPNQVTASNAAFLTAWIEENGGVSNNPLSVQTVQGGATAAQGIQAAADMLKSPQYQMLNAALTAGNASSYANNPVLMKELGEWSGGAISKPLDTKAHAAEANDQVLQANPQQAPTTRGERRLGEQDMAAQTSAPVPGQQLPSQPASPDATPAPQVAGQQGMSAPGDNYLGSSTISDVQAPSPQGAAFTEATTGANNTPYYANQAQAGLQAIINLIEQGPSKL